MATREDRAKAALSDPLLVCKAPHDDFTLEQLEQSYNFEKTSSDAGVFVRLLFKQLETIDRPRRVLDIGCGRGISQSVDLQWAVRSEVDEFWGVEPDSNVASRDDLFDNFQYALLEDADLPENHFDLAYSFAVMEHLTDPESFMRTVARSLRPGGVYMFLTPNAKHYFALIANSLRRLKLDEIVIEWIKGKSEGHYPIQYRINSERQIRSIADRSGFEPPEIAFVETLGPISYMIGPLKLMFIGLAWKRRIYRSPSSLLNLVVRLRKRSDDDSAG